MNRLIKAEKIREYRSKLIYRAEMIYGKPYNWCCLTNEQQSQFIQYIIALRDITEQFKDISTNDLCIESINWPEEPSFISNAPDSSAMSSMDHM